MNFDNPKLYIFYIRIHFYFYFHSTCGTTVGLICKLNTIVHCCIEKT